MAVKQGWLLSLIFFGTLALCSGCGQTSGPETTADGAAGPSEGASGGTSDLPTASITRRDGEDDDEEAEDVDFTEPAEGTPEWHIREIVKLRLMPYPALPGASDKKPEDETDAEIEARVAKELEHQSAVQRERNQKVVELARQAIALTHKDSEKELVFNVAVNHLLDSRLQLALAGEQEDVDALYEIAEALQRSKPNSDAAAAAALTIVNFAHANAVRYAQSEPKWIQEFANQAKLFASRVVESQAAASAEDASVNTPRATQLKQDASRAAQILLAAGQSCEAAGFAEDGKDCYQQLRAKFPDSIPAQQAAGIVRRLNLKGQPLQLAGPTLDGNFLSIEDFKGKTVLVVFWSSQAKPFVDQLPALTALLKKAKDFVAVVGVNLDTDELQLDNFLEAQGIGWPQIFYAEPEKRGWNSPVASYYGINSVPTMWIVDPAGTVAETELTPANLESKLKAVVVSSQKGKASAGKPVIQRAGSTSTK